MNYVWQQKWAVIALVLSSIRLVRVQFVVPMYPPLIAVPPPIQVAVAVPVEVQTTTISTTSTTKATMAIALPVPMPVPMPCPGYAVAPPPVVMVPVPQIRIPRIVPSYCSSSSSSLSCSTERRNRRKRRRIRIYKKRDIYRSGRYRRNSRKNSIKFKRREIRDQSSSDTELVKPELTYLNKNGEVKLRAELSHDDAKNLLSSKEEFEDSSSSREFYYKPKKDLATSARKMIKTSNTRRNNVVLKKGPTNHVLKKGKKFVFQPGSDKKITNISLSFQVS